ncbi:MAG TPA: alpha/beta hydrolase [Vicinamibacterales bacterium]
MTLQPHFFGAIDAPLFGCYHAPSSRQQARQGVLLCHPLGHEYMACYRTIRQAAVRLAQAGAGVLRFDFYGAGDSAGDASDGCPSRWVGDVATATAELQKRLGDERVAFAGLRLGASLALLALQDQRAAATTALILWDPIVNGPAYIEELTALQKQRFRRSSLDEVIGFPFASKLRGELERLDLLQVGRTARHVLIIETGSPRPETERLAARLRTLGATVDLRPVTGDAFWHEPNKSSVPASVIQSMVTWVRQIQ